MFNELWRWVLDFFGAGNIVLGILFLVAAPFVDRFVVRRKRISYRVLYYSKIAVGPEQLQDDYGPPQLTELVGQLNRMRIVIIGIRNTGSGEIDSDDFARPLSFTFGDRVVWNARVSEAGKFRQEIRSSLQFFHNRTDQPAPLLTVRDRLAQRVSRWWVGAAPPPGPDPAGEPRWHGVRLDPLTLRRKQKFKLVVVLEEPDEDDDSRPIKIDGKLKDTGVIKDDNKQRRFTLARVTGGLAAVLTVVLVLSLSFAPVASDPAIGCGSGELRVEGSSVFMPTMELLADEYTKACPSAHITAQPTGSIDGVRAVAALDPAQSAGLVALSDGKHNDQGGLHSEQVAVVVYYVVVNGSVGMDTLTTEQVRGIYSGKYQDWNQLRGGDPLPIRIVGRGQESGTRELFERRVLGTGESGLSSNECLAKDRNPTAPTIRCERDSNAQVVEKISTIPGAIGYADAPSVTNARKSNALTAVTLDGKVFDASAGVDSGYPFWTVEYLYARVAPAEGSLPASFINYVQRHDSARVRLKDAGYLPCTSPDRTPLELCNLR